MACIRPFPRCGLTLARVTLAFAAMGPHAAFAAVQDGEAPAAPTRSAPASSAPAPATHAASASASSAPAPATRATPASSTSAPATRATPATSAPAPATRATSAGSAPSAPTPAQSPLPIAPDKVLDHLNRTVSWYRGLQPVEQLQATPEDLLSRDKLHQQSVTALRLAFDFGRACAAILSAQPDQANLNDDSDQSTGFAGQLDRISDRVTQRVATLQSQLATLDEQLPHARAAEKTTLTAQRANLAAALALAREVQSSMQDMQRFQESALLGESKGQSGLAAQIAELQKSVPEAVRITKGSGGSSGGSGAGGNAGAGGGTASATNSPSGVNSGSASATTASSSTSAAASPTFRPDSAGVIALATEWFSLHGTRRQLNDAMKQTDSLLDQVETMRTAVTGAVRNIVRGAFASSTTADAAQLTAQKAALDAGATRFKQLSTVLVPIGEQGLTLESAQNTMQEWRNSLSARSSSVSRYLALRIGFLLGSVAVVLVISEIWRRATFRYLHDSRRRRQFLVLRRVAVGVALTVVIVFGLVSELGSIATYAGFVTAGIAVALQNVILAIVAYFFLIGRYGVRVGDRITLAGVTGRVVDIGLVRIYLMELAGPELHSTGRIVVLSNAVLFQPTALFKQIPGAEYIWHTITLTIAATADVAEASKRLKAAAESVYAQYRPSIERQYAIVQRLVDFDTSTPQPEIRVRWAESGLECSVRYPVEPENSATVDQQMLKALREALAQEPPLTLLSTEAVSIKTSGS